MKRSVAVVVIGCAAGALAYVMGIRRWGAAVLVGLGAFFAVKWLGLLPRE
jgi:hypothetical protein